MITRSKRKKTASKPVNGRSSGAKSLSWVCPNCHAKGALVSHTPGYCPDCGTQVNPTMDVIATWQELALRLHNAEYRLHKVESFHQEWMDRMPDLLGVQQETVEEMLEELQTFLPWDDDNEHDSWLWPKHCDLPDKE